MSRLFIAYVYTGGAGNMGFGQLDVEVEFPIKNGDDLTRALHKGLDELPEERKLRGKAVVVTSWRRFEE